MKTFKTELAALMEKHGAKISIDPDNSNWVQEPFIKLELYGKIEDLGQEMTPKKLTGE